MISNTGKAIALVLAVFVVAVPATALLTPPNDLILLAAPATVPGTVTTSTVGATLESGEPRPCGLLGATVWYSFTEAIGGVRTINALGSNYDTTIAVYTGLPLVHPAAGVGLTTIVCNDDFFGLISRVQFNAVAGTTYYVQGGGFNQQTGNLVLNLA